MVATSAFVIWASAAGASTFAAVGGVVVLGDGAVVVDCAPNSFAPAAFSSVGFAAVGVVVAGLVDDEAGASTFMAAATGGPSPLETGGLVPAPTGVEGSVSASRWPIIVSMTSFAASGSLLI